MSVDMGYDADGLRVGGSQAAASGATAGGAAGVLRGVACPAAAFGQVRGAAELAAALERSREAHAVLAERVAAHHAGLDVRAGGTARAGDDLTSATTALAER